MRVNKMICGFFMCVVFFGTGVYPARAGDNAVLCTIHAEPGSRFGTVDATVTLSGIGPETYVYYLAVAQGAPAPSAETIAAYASGRMSDGLTDGTTVRGRWIAGGDCETSLFSLRGVENVTRIPGETGFVDGYRYDVYIAAVNADGIYTVAAARDVMAQPFDSCTDGRTFGIRTARQLQNIQRLADLFTESKGRHGSMDYLTNDAYTFVLETDIDLYGREWIPIGNMDANPKYIFKGHLDGSGHAIRNLSIHNEAGGDGSASAASGLFGKTENAVINDLVLENVGIRATGYFGKREPAAGTLAGEMTGGAAARITVRGADITAYGADANCGFTGGVIGRATDTRLTDLVVENTVVNAGGSELYAQAAGGVVGYYETAEGALEKQDGSADSITEDVRGERLSSESTVTGGGCTGGVIGLLTDNRPISEANQPIRFETFQFNGSVNGLGSCGGVFGAAHAPESRAVSLRRMDASGSVSTTGHSTDSAAGGIAGALHGVTTENGFARGAAVDSKNGAAGGFVGKAEEAAFTQCFSRRDVSAREGAGGFVGTARDCDFFDCGVEKSLITAKRYTGGFSGQLSGNGIVEDCYSAADVTGDTYTGGFTGSIHGAALSANTGHTITVKHSEASGSVHTAGGTAGGFAGMLLYALAEDCASTGSVRANGSDAGGFCGLVSNMSRISNARATGDVLNTDIRTGGFAGQVTRASCVENAYATGSVTGFDETGGFAGALSTYGAPNTLTHCFSFARAVTGADESATRRFVGRMDFDGVEDCYAYLGGVVVTGRARRNVTPNAYGADGGDMNTHTLDNILTRQGWDTPFDAFAAFR